MYSKTLDADNFNIKNDFFKIYNKLFYADICPRCDLSESWRNFSCGGLDKIILQNLTINSNAHLGDELVVGTLNSTDKDRN